MQARRKDLVAQICLPDVLPGVFVEQTWLVMIHSCHCLCGDRVSVKTLGFGDAADVGLDPLPV